ncbi:MAG: hypothetical protein GXP54_05610, partial [Deltaproteobacteria bacterium]|nr:hypothetical protein [Deltaproteobacteria bacterium]
MLEGIHQKRTGEFRRVLRACAMAASRGRHALVLLVPRGQDPDGFMRSFHHHCRDKAGRPVRLVSLNDRPADSPAISRLASVFGLNGRPVVTDDARLTDLMGAADRLFERLAGTIARELATNDPGIGPGLLMIEGAIESERTVLAFLSHLSPPTALWQSITGKRLRPRQFLAVAAISHCEADGPVNLPEEIETLAVRSLRARDLEAAPDAVAEILLGELDPTAMSHPAPVQLKEVRPPPDFATGERRGLVKKMMDAGAFHDALPLIDGLDARTRVRCLVAAGRPDDALRIGLSDEGASTPDPGFHIEMGELALARADGHAAEIFIDTAEGFGNPSP